MVKEKEEKEFGNILVDSWKEYKRNFRLFFKTYIGLYIIPLAIVTIISTIMLINLFGSIPEFQQSLLTGKQITAKDMGSFSPEVVNSLLQYLGIALILSLGLVILNFILCLGIFYVASFNKGKMKSGEAIKGGLGYFWKTLGLLVLLIVFLIPLYILLIVPGLIFTVFWIFSVYILFIEKKGIWDSLKGSYHLVKGRWWKTFGYILLFGLIAIAISIMFSIPEWIIQFILTSVYDGNFPLLFGTLSTIGFFTKIAISMVVVPLGILFYKNMYLQWKEGKKK